jgi:hypothetical protein
VDGVRLTTGYMQLRFPKLLDYERPEVQRLAGAGWVRGRGVPWRRVHDPLPRAWLVADARVSADPGSDLRGIDPRTVALVDRAVALEPGPPGKVEILHDRPGDIRVAISTPRRQLLVVGESFHPGWRAAAGGEPGEPVRGFGDFLAVVVEAGDSDVRLTFDPDDLRSGKLVSGAGALLALLWLGASLLAARRAGQT